MAGSDMTHIAGSGKEGDIFETAFEAGVGGIRSAITELEKDPVVTALEERSQWPALEFTDLKPSTDYVVRLGEEIVTWRSYGYYGGAAIVEQRAGSETQSGFLVIGGSMFVEADKYTALTAREGEELADLAFPSLDVETCRTGLGTVALFDHLKLRQRGLLFFREALLPEDLLDPARVDEMLQQPIDMQGIAVEPEVGEPLTLLVPKRSYTTQPLLDILRFTKDSNLVSMFDSEQG